MQTNYELLQELFEAYFEARRNKRNTVCQLLFELDYENRLVALAKAIDERSYRPERSICFVVDKPVKREIFAAGFVDRVVHHLLYRQLAPLFTPCFIYDSYACLEGRGTLFGVERLEHHIRSCSENYQYDCYVLKLDIRGYFMSIDRSMLFRKLSRHINAKWESYRGAEKKCGMYWLDKETLLFLLEQVIFCDVTANCIIKGNPSDWEELPADKSLFNAREGCGLPIGNLTSQLFSNIYLNDFDHFVKRILKMKHYGRYVDDFYIVHRDKNTLRELLPVIRQYLKEETGLTLHPHKIVLQDVRKGIVFLGMTMKPYRCYAGRRIEANFNNMLKRTHEEGVNDFEKLAASVNSYLGIMKHSRAYSLRRKIVHRNLWIFQYGWMRNDYLKFCSVT
ncbi:RNA-directed DNA polymerase [Bacteroides sp. GM023]|uniref:RNA-directed DNA polymerase n=1 Tax=Bacteroides sp. GM023 TaxID=2723058 RepID=UPI00168BFDEB|nr:reverse transcriptase domain-containing protein [Bacteroides sp. GM023]MBD3592884.1 Retron-type reverse transcriptase [Bacteroides sp. GM023]